jgi:hypothetical protein
MRGTLYVLRNDKFAKNIRKIGRSVDVDSRVRQLSRSSGVPGRFVVDGKFETNNATRDENRVHLLPAKERFDERKEFFLVSKEKARTVCEYCVEYGDTRPHLVAYFREKLGVLHRMGEKKTNVADEKFLVQLCAATANNDRFEGLLGLRTGLSDGFVSSTDVANARNINTSSARRWISKFTKEKTELMFRIYDFKNGEFTIEKKVFEWLRYCKGELAWRFTVDYRAVFRNETRLMF